MRKYTENNPLGGCPIPALSGMLVHLRDEFKQLKNDIRTQARELDELKPIFQSLAADLELYLKIELEGLLPLLKNSARRGDDLKGILARTDSQAKELVLMAQKLGLRFDAIRFGGATVEIVQTVMAALAVYCDRAAQHVATSRAVIIPIAKVRLSDGDVAVLEAAIRQLARG